MWTYCFSGSERKPVSAAPGKQMCTWASSHLGLTDPPVRSLRRRDCRNNSRVLFQNRTTGPVWLADSHKVSDGLFQDWTLAASSRSAQQDAGLKRSVRSGPVPVADRFILQLDVAECPLSPREQRLAIPFSPRLS